MPKSYRRRRRHKRKAGHKEKKEKERVSENYSDKSDVENADESSSSILKPLSEYPVFCATHSWWEEAFQTLMANVEGVRNPGWSVSWVTPVDMLLVLTS